MKKIDLHTILLIFFSAAFFALSCAYISQYFFDLKPCKLCIYQRWPYFFILGFSFISLFFNTKLKKISFYILMAALLVNAALALYHVGVEKKIFKLSQGCSFAKEQNYDSIDELKAALEKESFAKCDNPQFLLFGLSMAAYNAIYCFSLIFVLLNLHLRRFIAD